MSEFMTTAGNGAAFAPSRAEIKAAKLAKARAVLHRGKPVSEHVVSVACPRHGRDFVMEATITTGFDGWFLKHVPAGCDGDDHDLTPDERVILTERIDEAFATLRTAGQL